MDQTKTSLNIVIYGTGNVAYHLVRAFKKIGQTVWLTGRNESKVSHLANALDAKVIDGSKGYENLDIVILAVSDTAISEIISNEDFGNSLVVHTSGSVAMNELAPLADHGVFYPLQTFSKDREVDFSEIPIFIEANTPENLEILKNLGQQLSNKVEECSSEQRKILHLAAVFACNFSNHLYAIAEQILEDHGLEFDSIAPLIKETALKAIDRKPKNAQTGPALRNDKNTLEKHLRLLENQPEFQKIYSFVSESILKFGNGNN